MVFGKGKQKNYHPPTEFKKGFLPWNKGKNKYSDPRISKIGNRTKRDKKTKKIISEGTKKAMKDPFLSQYLSFKNKGRKPWNKGLNKYTDKRVARCGNRTGKRGFCERPNSKEQLLNSILQKHFSNKWKYVGSGEFILGGKCPDFLNVNGQKKVIELFGDYWHKDDNPKNRINFFKSYGFDCLVIWEHELTRPELVVNKIKRFEGDVIG